MPDTYAAPGQRGAVRRPESDRRLKHNRHIGVQKSEERIEVRPGGQGRVKNPETDRRLKTNR
jgi:hypothetical protein